LLTEVSGDNDWLYRLRPTKEVLPDDRDRILSPKRRVLKNKHDGVFNRTMDNVQKHNICVLKCKCSGKGKVVPVLN
jgi:hypothetical protein